MKLKKYRSGFKDNLFLKLIFCVCAFFGVSNSIFAIGVCTTVTYNTGALIPVGVNPRQIVTGDLNGDNAPDMVVLTGGFNNSNAAANILLNDGRGVFTLSNNLAFNFAVNSILLADFNQDGTMDLAVAGSGSNSGGGTSQVVIYFNNGNGNFTSQTTFNAPGAIAAFAAGDFNGDGAVDIVTASSTSGNFGAVALFLNTGFGNFTSAGTTSVGGLPRTVNVADFNGDGRLDVVTINNNSTGSIIYGNGAGGFQLASNFSISANSSSIFPSGTDVGDFNNDRRPDLVIAVNDSNQFIILINNGTGGFGNPVAVNFPLSASRPRSVAVGQFVGDGNLDLAFVLSPSFSDGASLAVIVPGNGSGTFSTTNLITAPTGATPLSIAAADFNRDGATTSPPPTALQTMSAFCSITARTDTVRILFP
ncbi:MAG: VCBS repeat-containing protein [Acidobacteriota bacterium]|nr:VCBS repeat-containing protein [Acidobacteriota bacterium]